MSLNEKVEHFYILIAVNQLLTHNMSTGRHITVAAAVGIGSFFVYSLLKSHCKYCKCNGGNKGKEGDGENVTKGSSISPNEILNFWFGTITKKYDVIEDTKQHNWFQGGTTFDQEVSSRFSIFMAHALDHKKYEDWKETPKGLLALIITADQFTRNVYRGTSKMFAYDEYARELVRYGIEKGFDIELFHFHPMYYRFAVIIPLSHSEDIKDQQLALEKHKWCIYNIDSNHPAYGTISDLKWSKMNCEVIQECGRFPQRNHILGRETTEKEKDVIKKPNLMALISTE